MATFDLNCISNQGITDFYCLPYLKCCYFRLETSPKICVSSITKYLGPISLHLDNYEPKSIEPWISRMALDHSIKGDYKCTLTETSYRRYRISFIPNDIHAVFYMMLRGNRKCKQIVNKLYCLCKMNKNLVLITPLLRLELGSITDSDLANKKYKVNYKSITK